MSLILVTGANRGIGLEFTRQYLSRGERVIACCRNPDQSSELQSLACPELDIISLDISDEASITSLPGQLGGQKITVFINNAGVYGSKQALDQIDLSEWIEVFRVNTMAPLLLTRVLLPYMDAGARLAFLSSKMGSIAENTSGSTYVYRSSKTALNQVVRSLSHDLAHQGLPVVVLHPGWVKTDMGGPNALIDTQTSVKGLISVIDNLDESTSGHFFNYDGAEIPW